MERNLFAVTFCLSETFTSRLQILKPIKWRFIVEQNSFSENKYLILVGSAKIDFWTKKLIFFWLLLPDIVLSHISFLTRGIIFHMKKLFILIESYFTKLNRDQNFSFIHLYANFFLQFKKTPCCKIVFCTTMQNAHSFTNFYISLDASYVAYIQGFYWRHNSPAQGCCFFENMVSILCKNQRSFESQFYWFPSGRNGQG